MANTRLPLVPLVCVVLATSVSSIAQAQTAGALAQREAVGREARVTLLDGTWQNGTLASLSAAEVLLRVRGKDLVIPLAGVRSVEKTAHGVKKGALLGLLAGAAVGAVASVCSPEDDCPGTAVYAVILVPVFGGIGAGAGALIGGLMNPSPADRILYEAPPRATVQVAPVISPNRTGVVLAVRW